MLRKVGSGLKKRAYISVFEPVRPVSIPAYEMRGQAKAILDIF
jgi:hypothetical protein